MSLEHVHGSPRQIDVPEEALVSRGCLAAPEAPIQHVKSDASVVHGRVEAILLELVVEGRSGQGRAVRPAREGSALTAPVVQLSPAHHGPRPPPGGHGRGGGLDTADRTIAQRELSGAPGFGCADIPSFRVQSGTGLERELTVGPGGAWCVSGHSQVGSNSYLGRAHPRGRGLTSFAVLAPWLCPNPHVASASTRISPSRRP
jgi:hypothetical protein